MIWQILRESMTMPNLLRRHQQNQGTDRSVTVSAVVIDRIMWYALAALAAGVFYFYVYFYFYFGIVRRMLLLPGG